MDLPAQYVASYMKFVVDWKKAQLVELKVMQATWDAKKQANDTVYLRLNPEKPKKLKDGGGVIDAARMLRLCNNLPAVAKNGQSIKGMRWTNQDVRTVCEDNATGQIALLPPRPHSLGQAPYQLARLDYADFFQMSTTILWPRSRSRECQIGPSLIARQGKSEGRNGEGNDFSCLHHLSPRQSLAEEIGSGTHLGRSYLWLRTPIMRGQDHHWYVGKLEYCLLYRGLQ